MASMSSGLDDTQGPTRDKGVVGALQDREPVAQLGGRETRIDGEFGGIPEETFQDLTSFE